MATSSKIFVQNRALGYVSNHIPLVTRYIKCRKENLVVTSVGKAFHTYSTSRFTLLSVSNQHLDDITCLAADTYLIFTACQNTVFAWRRGSELKHTYVGHKKPVHLLLPFGPHLLSVDEDNVLKIWDIKTEELYTELLFDKVSFQVTALVHPSTYINKILVGSEQGSLQLWNINKSKLIYVFKGWDAAVTVLEQAPAIDVIAVGLANGKIYLHNLKFDETVIHFIQDWGFVTSISFRTDEFPIMATGSLVGHVIFWNLEDKKVATQLLNAHEGPVSGMKCLPNEPLMITSSSDNTLKMWIFDMSDGGPRLLRIREGHAVAPSYIRFHGSNGHNILSAGGDSSLRIFSTITETFNKSLGKASYNRKVSKKKGRLVEDPLRMPPIVQFTSENTREKEWDNIAAIHLGLALVTTWSYDKLKMGGLKLLPEHLNNKKTRLHVQVIATCVCLTRCGNFVIVGYNTGNVERFNIQSGIHRDTYGKPRAHSGPVRGVATDGLNQLVISGGSDKIIKFWKFKCLGQEVSSKLQLDEGISFFFAHHESSMMAVALEDYTILIVDIDTRTPIRKFVGHVGQLTDLAFSPDSKWLISSSMDCTIRTWDIPSANLIDCFKVDCACTSLSFSPTGDSLATAHVNCLGIYLWTNKTLFSRVSLRPLSSDFTIPLMGLPSSGICKDTLQEDNLMIDDHYLSKEQISSDLVTLSQLENSRWQNLLNIDIIKKRNKPKEPPKVPKSAPFLLPTIPSLHLQFDISKEQPSENYIDKSTPMTLLNLTVFGKILNDCKESNNYDLAIEKLKCYGPSAIDFEIASLSPEEGGSVPVMLTFLKLIETMLLSNKDFELAQAYLALFLKRHGNIIISQDSLRDYLFKLQSSQLKGWENLQERLLYCLSVVQNLKDK